MQRPVWLIAGRMRSKSKTKKYSTKHSPVYLDAVSLPYLEAAVVDWRQRPNGGQLTIKAPNAKVPNISPDSHGPEKVNYILATDIKPGLAISWAER